MECALTMSLVQMVPAATGIREWASKFVLSSAVLILFRGYVSSNETSMFYSRHAKGVVSVAEIPTTAMLAFAFRTAMLPQIVVLVPPFLAKHVP